MKVVVIGAGLSGLAAATRIQAAGHEVEVVEAGPLPGGRCKTLRRDGFILDCCPEIAASSYTRWLALIKDLGMSSDVVYPPLIVGMLKDGKQLDINVQNPFSTIFTSLLSWPAKFRVLGGMLKLLPEIRALPEYLLDAVELDDPSVKTDQLALKLFGAEATKYFIDPLVRLGGGTRMDLVSPVILRSTMSDFARLISLRGGLDRVPKALAAKLNVRYGTKVERVRDENGQVVIDYTDANGQSGSLMADKCLISAQYHDAERIYPRFRDIGKGFGDKLKYFRMIDIKLAYSKRTKSKAWGVFVPFCEDLDINFLTLTHNKSPDRAPEGHSLIGIFTEDLEYDRQAAMTDEELVAWARSRVEALHPELKGHFKFSYVSRQPRTCAIPAPGHFRLVRELWDAVGQEPRVHLTGDMFIYGSMECAVKMGERAADRLISTS